MIKGCPPTQAMEASEYGANDSATFEGLSLDQHDAILSERSNDYRLRQSKTIN